MTELESASSYLSRVFWLDLFDRVGKTFLQNVLLFFGAGVTITSVSWPTVLGAAALASLVTLLIGLATANELSTGNFVIDSAARIARTFFGSLVAAVPVTGGIADIDWKNALTIAGTAALLSLVTSLASVNLGASKGVPSLAPVIPTPLPEHVNPTGSVSEVDGD
ncbi:holin [Rhodococcoides fascians]|uniref:holin n=1 Tax=Rhodococcoides fascians TaxID=1828 RepID=UPI00068C2C55|nr:holin [Rhodococcus fascians]